MALSRLSLIYHIAMALLVGLFFALFILFNSTPDPQAQARALAPDAIKLGDLIAGDFGDGKGAAIFEIDGPIPRVMYKVEVDLPSGASVTPRTRKVAWKETPTSPYWNKRQRCGCFACATDIKICRVAAGWLSADGSLHYRNPTDDGTSYIINRPDRKIIIIWNRPL